MAITSQTAKQIGAIEWLLTAVSDLTAPTYYWYLNGVLAYTSASGQQRFRVDSGEIQLVEVFDSPTDAPTASYAGRATLQWDRWPLADSWLVEQWDADKSAWVKSSTIKAMIQSTAQYTTGFLADGSTNQYRVTPILSGNSGTPRVFDFPIVRTPSRPTISAFEYNATSGVLVATVNRG